MKKALSYVLAIILLVSMTTSFAAYEENDIINIPRFNGTVLFNELSGKATKTDGIKEKYDTDTVVKEGADNKQIRIDGVVSRDEWGEALITVDSDSASPEEAYFWHVAEGTNGLKLEDGLEMKLWMAWDTDYLYIAAQSDDADGPRGDFGGSQIYKGDCLEIKAKTSGAVNLCDIGASYLNPSSTSGKVSVYDMAERYYPHGNTILGSDKFVVYDSFDAGVGSGNPFGIVYGAVRPVSAPNENNTVRFVTTYELAIPWNMIDESHFTYSEDGGNVEQNLILSNRTPAVGDTLDIAVTILNSAYVGGDGTNNSYLTWGKSTHHEEFGSDPGASLEMNKVLLSSKSLGESEDNMKGDVDGDGDVTLKDILLIRKFVVGAAALDEEQITAGDANGDGDITLKDILLTRKHVSGVIKEFR